MQGWLRPGKLPKVLPFLSRTSPLLACWKPAEAPGAVELVFAFWNLLLTFSDVLHQCFSLPLSQEEWWRSLKYSYLLQWQRHARGTLRNQNESPCSNVSDCSVTMQCCPRKVTILSVLLDAESWLWLEPMALEQTAKGLFCRVYWGNSSCCPAELGTWLCVSFSCWMLEKVLALFPSGNHCSVLPQPLLLWTQVWYSPVSSPD